MALTPPYTFKSVKVILNKLVVESWVNFQIRPDRFYRHFLVRLGLCLGIKKKGPHVGFCKCLSNVEQP